MVPAGCAKAEKVAAQPPPPSCPIRRPDLALWLAVVWVTLQVEAAKLEGSRASTQGWATETPPQAEWAPLPGALRLWHLPFCPTQGARALQARGYPSTGPWARGPSAGGVLPRLHSVLMWMTLHPIYPISPAR